MQIKLASWNVNGIRAVSKKDDWKWFLDSTYDVIGFQETKASLEQLPKSLTHKEGYESYFASSVVKKGYSGTAVFSKIKPLNVEIELPDPAFQGEGRIVHLEFEKFHFFNGYFPNGGAQVVDENGKDAIENARIKAKTYYDKLKIPTIGMDNNLFFTDLTEDNQPGTHVRRINGKNSSKGKKQ